MPVAYAQTRNIARARDARFDMDAQIADLFTADDSVDMADAMYPDRLPDTWETRCMAESENIDHTYFAKHGYWPDWGFIAWLEKEEERREAEAWRQKEADWAKFDAWRAEQ